MYMYIFAFRHLIENGAFRSWVDHALRVAQIIYLGPHNIFLCILTYLYCTEVCLPFCVLALRTGCTDFGKMATD